MMGWFIVLGSDVNNERASMNQEQVSNGGPTTPSRHWFQWSLRGLMLFCVAVAIGVVWYKYQVKSGGQREIAKELRSKSWVVHGPTNHETIIVNLRQLDTAENDPNFSIKATRGIDLMISIMREKVFQFRI
jgi:hypothetical protein